MGTFIRPALLLAAALAILPSAAQAQSGIYGAIAYSNINGAYGYGRNYPSRGSAQNRAIAECRANGGRNCQVAVWFYNSCGALASGRSNGWGVGIAQSTRAAANTAIAYCRQNDRGCQVRNVICSGI